MNQLFFNINSPVIGAIFFHPISAKINNRRPEKYLFVPDKAGGTIIESVIQNNKEPVGLSYAETG